VTCVLPHAMAVPSTLEVNIRRITTLT